MLPPGPAQATGELRITHNVTPSAPSNLIPVLNNSFTVNAFWLRQWQRVPRDIPEPLCESSPYPLYRDESASSITVCLPPESNSLWLNVSPPTRLEPQRSPDSRLDTSFLLAPAQIGNQIRDLLKDFYRPPADRLERIAPEAWMLDQLGLDRKDNDAIQLQLFWDYQFNLDGYPAFQEYFRKYQPPLLVTLGKNDEEISGHIRDFLPRALAAAPAVASARSGRPETTSDDETPGDGDPVDSMRSRPASNRSKRDFQLPNSYP
jgi:hypothetical protein